MPRPRGRSPIARVRHRIDAAGDEALELGAALIENAEGGISRAGHPARDVEQLADDVLDLELGDEPAARPG